MTMTAEEINRRAAIVRVTDADGLFLEQALTQVEAKLYENLEAPLLARSLLRVSRDAPAVNGGTYTYQMVEHLGEAQWISNERGVVVLANAQTNDYSGRVRRMGDGFRWTIDDDAASAMQTIGPRINVMTERANAARKVIERKINTVGLLGDSTVGLSGLLNHTGLGTPVDMITSADYTGRWQLAATTVQQRVDDIAAMFSAYVTRVARDDMPPTHFLYPLSLNAIMNYVVPSTAVSIRKHLEATYPGTQFRALAELNTLGSSGALGRCMLFNNSPEYVDFVIPEEFRMLPPAAEGFGWQVLCTALTGGVRYRYPVTGMLFDGVLQAAAG